MFVRNYNNFECINKKNNLKNKRKKIFYVNVNEKEKIKTYYNYNFRISSKYV